jgi:Tfp pilus assembly protein PilO
MSKVLTPILFTIVAIGLFFSYLKPAYSELQASKERLTRIDEAIEESNTLLANYTELKNKVSAISEQDQKNLAKILPDAVDVVRLILDLDSLATKYGLTILSFEIPDIESELATKAKKKANTTVEESPVMKAVLTIECEGAYANFKKLLVDVERSMSLMDVVELEVAVSDGTQTDEEAVYTLGLQTYWLKEIK